MRLIDADVELKKLDEMEIEGATFVTAVSFAKLVLLNAPTADVQPLRKGHWQEANTHTYGIYECDVCRGWTYIPHEPRDYKFCPKCGARMEGDTDA